MNDVKQRAIDAMDELHQTIAYSQYSTVMDGLLDIEPLQERDEALEELWAQFSDVPMNPEAERIEAPFLEWDAGTAREEIWRWFDERHSRGVAYLLYGANGSEQKAWQSVECESSYCPYQHQGECRFQLVHERPPRLTERDGCIDFDYTEGGAAKVRFLRSASLDRET